MQDIPGGIEIRIVFVATPKTPELPSATSSPIEARANLPDDFDNVCLVGRCPIY